MRRELSSLDMKFLLEEFKALTNGRIDQIYQDKELFLFRFHVTGKGRLMLKVILPSLIFLSKHKKDFPTTPPHFCTVLRKHLGSARLRKIEQISSERILVFHFEAKEKKLLLYFELFSKGNIILCDDKNIIINAYEKRDWVTRSIRPKKEYKLPPTQINIFSLKESQLKELLENTKKDSLVKFLASEVGLGGLYSEEICLRLNLDKTLKPSKADASKLFKEINSLINTKPKPAVIEGKDVVPFSLNYYKNEKVKEFKTFSEALDEVFSKDKIALKLEKISSAHDQKLEQAQRILESQLATIKNLQKKIDENTAKGEFIYEHYTEIKSILDEIKKAREKYSWKELKEKLKNHKVIKRIIEKDNSVVIDIK